MKFALLLVVSLAVSLAGSNSLENDLDHEEMLARVMRGEKLDLKMKVQACSTELARARVLACYNDDLLMLKRRENSIIGPFGFNRPWASSFRMLKRQNQDEPGLVDRCCLNICTVADIIEYC